MRKKIFLSFLALSCALLVLLTGVLVFGAYRLGQRQLADSLALFEEGTKLIAACSQELDAAEQKVVKLMKGPDGAPVELPFGEEEQG